MRNFDLVFKDIMTSPGEHSFPFHSSQLTDSTSFWNIWTYHR